MPFKKTIVAGFVSSVTLKFLYSKLVAFPIFTVQSLIFHYFVYGSSAKNSMSIF
jgi:hypothetical protein